MTEQQRIEDLESERDLLKRELADLQGQELGIVKVNLQHMTARRDLLRDALSVETEKSEDLERQLAESREQAERLAGALDKLHRKGQIGLIMKPMYVKILAARDARVRAETLRAARAIAIGCHDYGGGYQDDVSRKIFHHGMDTVATAIQAMINNPNDLQALTVLAIGKRAGRGEWPKGARTGVQCE